MKKGLPQRKTLYLSQDDFSITINSYHYPLFPGEFLVWTEDISIFVQP